nr:MAG TPA: hypothetical protein [Caudoviricetes sp.]DAR22351.1 MAG TPA: hypothetical protein [Caudoviricetes sp.]
MQRVMSRHSNDLEKLLVLILKNRLKMQLRV